MIIKNIQICVVVIMLIHSDVSQCAYVDPSRPDSSRVVDMGKIASYKRDARPSGYKRNRGRLHTPNQGNSFELEHALVIVPGQNGEIGSSADRFSSCLQKDSRKRFSVSTPMVGDFGQAKCMQRLYRVLSQESNVIPKDMHSIFFLTSQGSATGINFFNDKAQGASAQVKKPIAIIVQSGMLSGNSAIYHTVTNIFVPFVAYLPLSYYWLPYLAKIGFPFYCPGGDQPVFNVKNIPNNIPIIILHCTNDQQLSFEDAQGFYAELCRNGNKNVYFFEMPNSDGMINHFVRFDEQTKKDILTILKNHKIIPREDDLHDSFEDEVALRQPKVKQEWQDHFDNVLKKEKRVRYFGKFLTIAIIGLSAYVLYTHDIVNKALNGISFNK